MKTDRFKKSSKVGGPKVSHETPAGRSRDQGNHTITQTEEAYQLIKRAILRGEIPQGAFLSEADILGRYGIGRTPFREACNRLHHEQLLEVVPRRGYLVPEMSFLTVRDLFETRLLLEETVAELAAMRAQPSQIEEMAEVMGDSEAASSNGRVELIEANTQFHLQVARMTQNRELVKLMITVLERNERVCYIEFQRSQFRWKEFEMMHRPILDAVRRRDPSAARKAIRNDITAAQLNTLRGDHWQIDGAANVTPWPVSSSQHH